MADTTIITMAQLCFVLEDILKDICEHEKNRFLKNQQGKIGYYYSNGNHGEVGLYLQHQYSFMSSENYACGETLQQLADSEEQRLKFCVDLYGRFLDSFRFQSTMERAKFLKDVLLTSFERNPQKAAEWMKGFGCSPATVTAMINVFYDNSRILATPGDLYVLEIMEREM